MIDQTIPHIFAAAIVFAFMYTNGVFSAPPSELTLLSAGVWAASAGEPFFPLLAAACIGNTLGASTLYLIGYMLGERRTVRLITRVSSPLDRRFSLSRRYRYTRKFLRVAAVRNPIFLYAVCRSLPVVRSIVSLPAGVERFPFFRFITYSVLGISLWCTSWIWAGYTAGALETTKIQRIFLIAALVVVYLYLKRVAREVTVGRPRSAA
jgi:membrane protein DedA with SNARE-associated domain